MDLGDHCPELLARCHPGIYSLKDFIAKAHAFVEELQRFHPAFRTLHLVGKSDRDSPALAPDLSNLDRWLLARAWDAKAPRYWFSHLDANDLPTPDTTVSLGFNLGLTNLQSWDDKVDVSVHAGCARSAVCNFILPRKSLPEFRRPPLPRQLLELVLRHWPVRFASYSTGGWNRNVNWIGEQEDHKGCMEIGWLTYVDDPRVAHALPAGIDAQPLGAGVVFELTDHLSSFEDAADVAQGLRVKQALREAGLLRRPQADAELPAAGR